MDTQSSPAHLFARKQNKRRSFSVDLLGETFEVSEQEIPLLTASNDCIFVLFEDIIHPPSVINSNFGSECQ